jgi:hypothetical protein
VLVFASNKILIRLFWKFLPFHEFFYLLGYLERISINVIIEVILPEHTHNPYKLVVIILPLEKCVDFENHTCHSASKGPNVQRIVV